MSPEQINAITAADLSQEQNRIAVADLLQSGLRAQGQQRLAERELAQRARGLDIEQQLADSLQAYRQGQLSNADFGNRIAAFSAESLNNYRKGTLAHADADRQLRAAELMLRQAGLDLEADKVEIAQQRANDLNDYYDAMGRAAMVKAADSGRSMTEAEKNWPIRAATDLDKVLFDDEFKPVSNPDINTIDKIDRVGRQNYGIGVIKVSGVTKPESFWPDSEVDIYFQAPVDATPEEKYRLFKLAASGRYGLDPAYVDTLENPWK